MFSIIKSLFSTSKLDFKLDVNDKNQHLVEVFINIQGNKEKLQNINALWNYGTKINTNGKSYKINHNDIEILLSLRSLNPDIYPDGTMVFDVCPPVLKYLRKRKSVFETEISKNSFHLTNKELIPSATIDYEKNKCLKITTGLKTDKTSDFIGDNSIIKTRAGNYVFLDKKFYKVPKTFDNETKELLELNDKKIYLSDIPEFFKKDLVLLRTKLNAVLTQNASKITIHTKKIRPKVRINKTEKGWLDFDINYVGDDLEIPFNIYSEGKEYMQVNDYSWVEIDKLKHNNLKQKLHKLNPEKTDTGFRIPITRFSSLEDFIEHIGGIREISKEYSNFLEQLTALNLNESYLLPEKIEKELQKMNILLRSYQRAGIQWLEWLGNNYLHGILADDMGLGKTLQTILTIKLMYKKEYKANNKHSLVIAPRSVIHHWRREINRFFPEINVYEYIGSNRDSSILLLEDRTIIISTYETISRDIETFKSQPFFYLVLDEATKIKNPKSKRTKLIKLLNAVHRIALSGTPVENRILELWSIFDFLMEGHLGSQANFITTFEKPITNENDDNAKDLLSKRIRPFMLRRLKENVAKDLPEKIIMEEFCELSEEQKQIYNHIQNKYAKHLIDEIKRYEKINYTCILSVISKLKLLCNHPALITQKTYPLYKRSNKFDLILHKIMTITQENDKIVLFSQSLGTLNLFGKALNEKGKNYIRIDGSTNNRQSLIDKFNHGSIDVALCSIKACAYGINLIGANHIIHIDRWWNPATEDQATDRVHRIGQDKQVYVYTMTVQNSLEEKIISILEKKRNISDKVIGKTLGLKIRFTREELIELLKPIQENF